MTRTKTDFHWPDSYPPAYLDQVQQQRGLEHPVELDIIVLQQVLQTATGTVLRHHSKYITIGEEAQEKVDVFIPQVLHLCKSNKQKKNRL